MQVLVSTGLQFPQGVAVDDYRQMLYVADPSLGKLVRYKLQASGDTLQVGKMETVASGVEVRAVAVDGLGNVWFTDEPNQRIMRVTAQMIQEGRTTPQTVYDGSALKEVSSPGGIAVDNFFVYWLNKAGGQGSGTLVRALQHPAVDLGGNVTSLVAHAPGVHKLADNADKCYGICLALGNAYFSDEFKSLYGVSRAAVARSEEVAITGSFTEPRGCAYDGDSTVYVADKTENAIYGFAANMERLMPGREMVKAAELQGAFGVTVFTDLGGAAKAA